MDEKRVFTAISDLFPKAREHNTGIQTFYLQVQENLGMDLDDNLWIPFVWDTVYTMMAGSRQRINQDTSAYSHVKHKTQADQESQNSENEAANVSIT